MRIDRKVIIIGVGIIATICIGGVLSVFREQQETNSRSEEQEIQVINEYLQQEKYCIMEIPEGMSVAPCPTEVIGLQYPRYLLMAEKNEGTTRGNYYYPFNSSKEARWYYNKLDSDEQEDFYLLAQSIIYAPQRTKEFDDMLERIEQELLTEF